MTSAPGAEQDDVARAGAAALRGNDAAKWPDKMPVRQRLQLLLDPDSWVEDGLLADAAGGGLPADGVLTGVGTIEGRQVAVIAHDFTVKAGIMGSADLREADPHPGARRPRPAARRLPRRLRRGPAHRPARILPR